MQSGSLVSRVIIKVVTVVIVVIHVYIAFVLVKLDKVLPHISNEKIQYKHKKY